MSKPLKVGIAGLGTVGVGTFKLLEANSAVIAMRCGRPLAVTAVAASRKEKDRGSDVSGIAWFNDGAELAAQADVDVVVEVIGGADGVARKTVETALGRKIHVVTANKALLATHGVELAKTAEDNGVSLAYEAAVAGGVPIIKALRESLSGNEVRRITGILNGTCNYILSTMRATGRDFDDVLREAQALGYAEADPSFDVDGIDAAHKLAILTSVAFGTSIDINSVHVEG
ncbi:MAG: homoserine dehydrogenase, partial [Rhodospirillaceae bacterium]